MRLIIRRVAVCATTFGLLVALSSVNNVSARRFCSGSECLPVAGLDIASVRSFALALTVDDSGQAQSWNAGQPVVNPCLGASDLAKALADTGLDDPAQAALWPLLTTGPLSALSGNDPNPDVSPIGLVTSLSPSSPAFAPIGLAMIHHARPGWTIAEAQDALDAVLDNSIVQVTYVNAAPGDRTTHLWASLTVFDPDQAGLFQVFLRLDVTFNSATFCQ